MVADGGHGALMAQNKPPMSPDEAVWPESLCSMCPSSRSDRSIVTATFVAGLPVCAVPLVRIVEVRIAALTGFSPDFFWQVA